MDWFEVLFKWGLMIAGLFLITASVSYITHPYASFGMVLGVIFYVEGVLCDYERRRY